MSVQNLKAIVHCVTKKVVRTTQTHENQHFEKTAFEWHET